MVAGHCLGPLHVSFQLCFVRDAAFPWECLLVVLVLVPPMAPSCSS